MEMWCQDVVDADVEGFVEFGPNGVGGFQFAFVSGEIDYRDSTRDGKPSVEWSWDGNDEMDAAKGRGWAVIDGDKIHGVIAIHHGDESEFEAIRKEQTAATKRPIKPIRRAKKPAATVYQFKVMLLRAKPMIWRRIQVRDCTLDKLHEHIQTSMGWTNSHLHRFRIGEQPYADPMLMEEDFEEFGYKDSTTTVLSGIIPKTGKRFRFEYEYDFGDGWKHEVLFEGCPKVEVGRQYPLCLEGERACPPEDVGGVQGYAAFLQAIQDKSHEEREAMFEWVDGWFDPEEFDPVTATKSMKKGLPDWRKEEAI
jgi:hypothetical protein